MKAKVTELSGAALDWAVAKCEGYECDFGDEESGPWLFPQEGYLHDEKPLADFRPSTNWSQGGPIIEREKLCVCPTGSVYPGAPLWSGTDDLGGNTELGPTPLIAAMRCYVSSKLGDEVDIPDALSGGPHA